MLDFYNDLISRGLDYDKSFARNKRTISFCIDNNLFVSFGSWRYAFIEDSLALSDISYASDYLKSEALQKAKVLQYRAIYNIPDDSMNFEHGLSFDFNCAVRITMEIVFVLILLFVSVLGASTLPSEYYSGGIRILYRSRHKRNKTIFSKIIACFLSALALSFLSFICILLVTSFFYGFTGFNSLSILSLPFNYGKVFPINTIVFYFLLLLLQSFEIMTILILSMAVSTQFINPIPSVMICSVLTIVSSILGSVLFDISGKPWMKYFFAFSMNIK